MGFKVPEVWVKLVESYRGVLHIFLCRDSFVNLSNRMLHQLEHIKISYNSSFGA